MTAFVKKKYFSGFIILATMSQPPPSLSPLLPTPPASKEDNIINDWMHEVSGTDTSSLQSCLTQNLGDGNFLSQPFIADVAIGSRETIETTSTGTNTLQTPARHNTTFMYDGMVVEVVQEGTTDEEGTPFISSPATSKKISSQAAITKRRD